VTCTMSELDELIEKLEDTAEYIEKQAFFVYVFDPVIYKALATILKTLKELQSQLLEYYTYTGH